jgi:hypothetical protein
LSESQLGLETVINCTGFEHKFPLRSNLRYPPTANLQTWTKKIVDLFKNKRIRAGFGGVWFSTKGQKQK